MDTVALRMQVTLGGAVHTVIWRVWATARVVVASTVALKDPGV
jgi:hypothetical protein